MEFATETQTGPSRWTTDDVDVISPTMPELQHSQRTWPIPMTLFAVAITLVIIGMKWREARRKRKLKEWRIARSVSRSQPDCPKHWLLASRCLAYRRGCHANSYVSVGGNAGGGVSPSTMSGRYPFPFHTGGKNVGRRNLNDGQKQNDRPKGRHRKQKKQKNDE